MTAKVSPRGRTGGQGDDGEDILASIRRRPVLPPYGKPNWCDWCARYHPRFYLDCLRPPGRWECPGEFDGAGRLVPHAECAA